MATKIKLNALPALPLNVTYFNKKGVEVKGKALPYTDLYIITLGGGWVELSPVTDAGDRFVESLGDLDTDCECAECAA